MTSRCARCGRKVAAPVLIAKVVFGPTCAKKVEGYVTRKKAPREEPVFVDPRQMTLLEAA